MSDMPDEIWAVSEPDDISAQIMGEVYAQKLPDGMNGKPIRYVPADRITTLEAENAALKAKLAKAVEGLEWYENHRLDAIARVKMDLREDPDVLALCRRYGYGAVIDSACRQWARLPTGSGAFFVGGCIADKTAHDALAQITGGNDA